MLAAKRSASARAEALAHIAVADPGPHPLLPTRLHPRRRELRDKLTGNTASFWASADLLAEIMDGARSDLAQDLDLDVLHGVDAEVAWEALLAAQDADPELTPDEDLCAVVAQCARVERGEGLDPLLAGTWWVSQDLVERLNATSSPEASAEDYAAQLAETEEFVVRRCGEPARSLVRYVAAETTLHYCYPEGSWPTVDEMDGELGDHEGSVGTWARTDGWPTGVAVALAARVAAALAELSRHRVAALAS